MNNTGWICCKCEAVMNPSHPTCWYCKPKHLDPQITEGFPFPKISGLGQYDIPDDNLQLCAHQIPLKSPCLSCIQLTRAHGIPINSECQHEWEYKGDSYMVNHKRCKKCGQQEGMINF